jgi:hypothetical protein
VQYPYTYIGGQINKKSATIFQKDPIIFPNLEIPAFHYSIITSSEK